MPMIDPSPTAEELNNLATLFRRVESSVAAYLRTTDGENDPNFDALTAAALSLNNAADVIGVLRLKLATVQGLEAVHVINNATAELSRALVVRARITRALDIVEAIVAFGGAIAADDVASIIDTGNALSDALNPPSQDGGTSSRI